MSTGRDSLDVALDRIAGGALSGVNLADGLSLALQVVAACFDVCAVVDALRADPNAADRVVARLRTLASDGGDVKYAHTHDAAMLGLLYALHEVAPKRAVAEVRLDWPEDALRARWFVRFARLLARGE